MMYPTSTKLDDSDYEEKEDRRMRLSIQNLSKLGDVHPINPSDVQNAPGYDPRARNGTHSYNGSNVSLDQGEMNSSQNGENPERHRTRNIAIVGNPALLPDWLGSSSHNSSSLKSDGQVGDTPCLQTIKEETIDVRSFAVQETVQETTKEVAWADLTGRQKVLRILSIVCRISALLTLLYFFICSLDLLSSAFTLIGGRAAGGAFQSPLLENPLCGLMIGLVSTAILQSSSTSTSIVITMVAANLLTVKMAIPIIMGANIGTSVTGVIVSVTQAADREQFRRAFAAATVHDMFNWLSVLVLLPVEMATGYLYHLTNAIVSSTDLAGGQDQQEFLKVITKPFTDLIIQLDKEVLDGIASGDPAAQNKSLLKYWCEYDYITDTMRQEGGYVEAPDLMDFMMGVVNIITSTPVPTIKIGTVECRYLFHGTSLSEQVVGVLLLIISLSMLIACLIFMVKVLKGLLQGSMSSVIMTTINADFPGKAAFLTGYVAMLVGAFVTVLVQSSSVVASALTPLVGIGLVTVERVYPMMLGANIGTTSTAILAAFAATGDRIVPSFQIAMCHLFFNLTGILIWYPVPVMRRLPIRLAKFLGDTTAKYRWFAFLYLIVMFLLLPISVFLLSLPGMWLLLSVLIPVIIIVLFVIIVNVLQDKKPSVLPLTLRDWDWLPLCLRSLEPMDRQVTKMSKCCGRYCSCCCCCCSKKKTKSIDASFSPDSRVHGLGHDNLSRSSTGSDQTNNSAISAKDISFESNV